MRGGKQGRASRKERRGEGILGTGVLRPEASVELGPRGGAGQSWGHHLAVGPGAPGTLGFGSIEEKHPDSAGATQTQDY